MKMDELLKNRWSERDRELNEKILKSQSEMNRRGILHSTSAVKALHEVFADELSCSRQTIVSTVADSLRLGNENEGQVLQFALPHNIPLTAERLHTSLIDLHKMVLLRIWKYVDATTQKIPRRRHDC